MYVISTIEDRVRVLPENFGKDREASIKKSLAEMYENKLVSELGGIVLAIVDVLEVGQGKIVVDDPAVHYPVKFTALVFKPVINEVVEGQVVDITEFGVFIRFGPLDALCHISQVTNDYLSYDRKNVMLSARDSKKVLRVGHFVRARITGVSLKRGEQHKIILTMRQPGLGAIEWLEMEKTEKEKAAKQGGKGKK